MSSKSNAVYKLWNNRAVSYFWRSHHHDNMPAIQRNVLFSPTSLTSRLTHSTSTPGISVRNQSTQSSNDKWTFRTGSLQDVEISKRLRLVRPGTSHAWPYAVNPGKVLIIFLPWLNSKEKHVNKYVQLYLDLGLDVLCVKSKPQDFLWPPTSFGVARELSEVLKESKHYDHYIFHSMSIGSYNLTTFRVLAKDVADISELNNKVCGIIYDSIVIGAGRGGALEKSENDGDDSKAIDGFIRGMASSVKGSKFILPIASLVGKVYFTLTKKQTLDYYERAYDVVRDEPAKVPTLLFASKNDPMCDKEVVEQIVKIWRDKHGVPITLQMWDASGHAQHLSFHRKEYIDMQRKFFDKVFGENGEPEAGSKPPIPSKL